MSLKQFSIFNLVLATSGMTLVTRYINPCSSFGECVCPAAWAYTQTPWSLKSIRCYNHCIPAADFLAIRSYINVISCQMFNRNDFMKLMKNLTSLLIHMKLMKIISTNLFIHMKLIKKSNITTSLLIHIKLFLLIY